MQLLQCNSPVAGRICHRTIEAWQNVAWSLKDSIEILRMQDNPFSWSPKRALWGFDVLAVLRSRIHNLIPERHGRNGNKTRTGKFWQQPLQPCRFAPGVWIIIFGLQLKVNWRSCEPPCEHADPADSAGPLKEQAALRRGCTNSAIISPQLSKTVQQPPRGTPSRTNTSCWVDWVVLMLVAHVLRLSKPPLDGDTHQHT